MVIFLYACPPDHQSSILIVTPQSNTNCPKITEEAISNTQQPSSATTTTTNYPQTHHPLRVLRERMTYPLAGA
jgi:hypothetical protein